MGLNKRNKFAYLHHSKNMVATVFLVYNKVFVIVEYLPF